MDLKETGYEDMDWMYLAQQVQCKFQLQAIVNTAMNLCVP
jgi:hypothetical protein